MTDYDIIKNMIYENTSNIIEFIHKYMFFYCDYGYCIYHNNELKRYCILSHCDYINCYVCNDFDMYEYNDISLVSGDCLSSSLKFINSIRLYSYCYILSIGVKMWDLMKPM